MCVIGGTFDYQFYMWIIGKTDLTRILKTYKENNIFNLNMEHYTVMFFRLISIITLKMAKAPE